jgi:hypothetical protein
MAPTNNPAERRRIVFLVPLSGYALDDKTLKVLWSFNTGSLNSAPPMTYSVDGKQYVAVLIGANVVAQGMLAKAPEDKDIQNTSMLLCSASKLAQQERRERMALIGSWERRCRKSPSLGRNNHSIAVG